MKARQKVFEGKRPLLADRLGNLVKEKKKKDPLVLPTVFPYCLTGLGRAPYPPHLEGLAELVSAVGELCPYWEVSLQLSALEDISDSLPSSHGQEMKHFLAFLGNFSTLSSV